METDFNHLTKNMKTQPKYRIIPLHASKRKEEDIPVSPSTQLGQLWFCGLYVGKRLIIYLGDKHEWKPTHKVVGTSDDWPSLLQTLADFHCTPILKATESK